jgi:hypothetical protein
MATHQNLDTRLLNAVVRKTRMMETAEREQRAAIVAAHRGGVGSRRIGEAVGLSHTRVLQIIREGEGSDG